MSLHSHQHSLVRELLTYLDDAGYTEGSRYVNGGLKRDIQNRES